MLGRKLPFMQRNTTAVIGIIILAAFPFAAKATTFKVSSPYIEPGKVKAEWQGYYSQDDDRSKDTAWKQNFILGYGINDFWKTQVKVIYEKGGQGQDPDLTATSFENTFKVTPAGTYLDAAVKFDYAHFYSGDTADNAAAKLILARNTEDFLNLFNLRVTHNIGEDHTMTAGIAWSTKYKYSMEVQPGFEIYNDFGSIDKKNTFRNQNRSFGPVLNGNLRGVEYQAGVLFGLTEDTPDETFKISIGYQF